MNATLARVKCISLDKKLIKSAISGGDIPIPAEERGNPGDNDVTNAHTLGVDAVDVFDPPGKEALDSELRNEDRPNRKGKEKRIYVQLSDNNSDPVHMPNKQRRVSRSPSPLDQVP